MILNYSNPMAMLCRAMQRKSDMTISGLCHSVQGTAAMLARWIGTPMDQITYVCAGVNHTRFISNTNGTARMLIRCFARQSNPQGSLQRGNRP